MITPLLCSQSAIFTLAVVEAPAHNDNLQAIYMRPLHLVHSERQSSSAMHCRLLLIAAITYVFEDERDTLIKR